MNRAVRKYLRQVKKHLFCPVSQKKKFLHRLEDELLLYCDTQEEIDYMQLTEHFSAPEEAAADFLTALPPAAISRFARRRLRFAYLFFGIVLVTALSMAAIGTVDYLKTRQLVTDVRYSKNVTHNNGCDCTMFWVRTQFRGDDIFWEYHSCDNMFYLAGPEAIDETEPYAVNIYTYANGNTTHWTFGQDHRFWIKVHDTD